MAVITIDLAQCPDKLDVVPALVDEIHFIQQRRFSFDKIWSLTQTFQEVGLSRAQAYCLWVLLLFDASQQASEHDTLVKLGLTCKIEVDGVAWVEIDRKDLRFTPEDRWLIGVEDTPHYKYLDLAVRAALNIRTRG